MSGSSQFHGNGPMVTGADNQFGALMNLNLFPASWYPKANPSVSDRLQNLGIHIGSLDAGNGGTIYQGTVKGAFGIDHETAQKGGVIVQGSNGLQNLCLTHIFCGLI